MTKESCHGSGACLECTEARSVLEPRKEGVLQVTVRVVHAFTRDGSGGNPAGMVLDADRISAAQRQEVARRVGLSETAFVSASTLADYRVEFFTPNRQIAHCGHATIGVFGYLVQSGRLRAARSSKETLDGRREIEIRDGRAFMEQLAPTYTPIDARELTHEILPALAIDESRLDRHLAPVVADAGNRFLLLPLGDGATLTSLRPDLGRLEKLSERHDLVGVYPFVAPGREAGFHAETRMFGPRYGIPEESATGMAAGPLAAFLHDRRVEILGATPTAVRISQGSAMSPPSPSEILVHLDLSGGRVSRILAGGSAEDGASFVVELDEAPEATS